MLLENKRHRRIEQYYLPSLYHVKEFMQYVLLYFAVFCHIFRREVC